MKIALCDFDEKYLSSLLTYLYGKCTGNSFFTFTTLEDYEESLIEGSYEYVVMGDTFHEALKHKEEIEECVPADSKLIILSSSIDKLSSDEGHEVYKFGPMDGLCRMMSQDSKKVSQAKSFAIYSPAHHELTEMYGLSMSQMLSENMKVLLVDAMHCPVIRRLIRDGPTGSIVDVIYKLENGKVDEIRDLIEEFGGVDILPFALTPTDVISISKSQWSSLIDYIMSLGYEAYVFVIDDINQGFREIMEMVDSCVLINRRGDYYKMQQEDMRDYIRSLGTKITTVELLMSANNLNEGCYQLEELLTGNLGRYVRSQHY